MARHLRRRAGPARARVRRPLEGPGAELLPEAGRPAGVLLVREVVPFERFSFELTRDRLGVEVKLRAMEANRTRVAVAIDGRFVIGPRRRLPAQALTRLYNLVQTGAEL